MALTERQKTFIRIGTAYVNGETPDPVDVESVKKPNKGGRPATGESLEQFQRKISIAWCYFYARAKKNMTPDEALADALKAWDFHGFRLGKDSLKDFCSYLTSGKIPDDPKQADLLAHTRAALRQVYPKYAKKFREAHRLKCEAEQISISDIQDSK